MIRFKHFVEEVDTYQLFESPLTFAQLTRDDRAYRADLFLKKYKANTPFETVDGDMVTLKYNSEIENAIKSSNSKLARSIGLETIDGTKITFGKLAKTAEFGGGGRGSGGGAQNTRATESAQCVYLQAIWDNPSTTFSPEDIAQAFGKTKTDAKPDEVQLGDEEWISSSIKVARTLHKVLSKKDYEFHRGSSWVDALEAKFKELNKGDMLSMIEGGPHTVTKIALNEVERMIDELYDQEQEEIIDQFKRVIYEVNRLLIEIDEQAVQDKK